MAKSLETRLWEKVEKTSTCWLWRASKNSKGYGLISVNGVLIVVSRVVYMMHYGNIPKGLFVCHTCDVRSCVRPDHLFLGSAKDNTQDMLNKGRGRNGGEKGENHPSAKLTLNQLLDAKARYDLGGVTQKQLAEELGVTKSCLANAFSGYTWKGMLNA